jgi:hypothetical protein
MVRTPRDSVTHYVDHLQDVSWVEKLVREFGFAGVLRSCVDVLTDQDPEEVHEVTTFLRDIGIRGTFDDELVAKARELMPSGVLPALRPLLQARVLRVRRTAIYTIGKLSFSGEAEALREAFPLYLDRDPVCLARLLLELQWLGDDGGVQAMLERVVAHQCYLVRWSALAYLGCSGTPSGAELRLKSRWLAALSSDPVPQVRAEAGHQLAELKVQVAGREAGWQPKTEWRRKRRALEKAGPSMTFAALEVRFLNELARHGQADYALEELDAFVQAEVAP